MHEVIISGKNEPISVNTILIKTLCLVSKWLWKYHGSVLSESAYSKAKLLDILPYKLTYSIVLTTTINDSFFILITDVWLSVFGQFGLFLLISTLSGQTAQFINFLIGRLQYRLLSSMFLSSVWTHEIPKGIITFVDNIGVF